MSAESNPIKHEVTEKSYTTPPAVESILNSSQTKEPWLQNVANNEFFQEQVKERQTIIEHIDEVISKLPQPNMSLQEAFEKNILSEEQISNLYKSLSDLVGNDDYKRVLLYIPFEFLPSSDWNPDSEVLKQSIERFRATYMSSWESLLHTHDVRANFVNGDVLEVELRTDDLPRVAKVAHLIPKLVQKNMITVEQVLTLMDESTDDVLKQSILDSVFVLADLGLIDEELQAHIHSLDKKDKDLSDSTNLDSLNNETFKEFSSLLNEISNETYSEITQNRAKWLQQERKQKATQSIAHQISDSIIRGTFSNEYIQELTSPNSPVEYQEVLILGIQNAIESTVDTTPRDAEKIYSQYETILTSLWNQNIPEIRDALSTTFYHLHGLHIIDDSQLKSFGLSIPALAGPFSKNLSLLEEETKEILDVIERIESDSFLSQYVYPVVLLSGSRLKGYAKSNADVDVAIFIKPGTPRDEKKNIQQALRNTFTSPKTQGEIIEFWLDETESGLTIHDFDEVDSSTGESYLTHNLFGAIWEGNKQIVEELQKKILTQYMYETDELIHEKPARSLYIEELERDTLQYRLMHKGYARFFAPAGGIHTIHSNHIDSESMFWDSGYRQTALKLYANRVFLPKIPIEV